MSANFLIDLKNTTVGGVSVLPQTVASATTTSGSWIDMQQSEDVVTALLLTGNCGDTTLSLTVTLEEAKEDPANPGVALSSDASAMTDGAFAVYSGATAADSLFQFIGSRKRSKRFVRAKAVTAGGGTLSAPIAVAVFGRKKIAGSTTYTGYTNAPLT